MPEEVVGPAAAATRPTDVLALVEQIAADRGARSHLAVSDHPSRLDQRRGIALSMATITAARLLRQTNKLIRLGQRGSQDLAEDVLAGAQGALGLLRADRWASKR